MFESDLEELNNKYVALDTQLTDITTELSNPNLDFNKLSNDTLEALNDWSDEKTKISNLFNPLNEKANSIETSINEFVIAE